MSVALRPLKASDADRTFAWRTRPEVADFMFGEGVILPEDHAAWLEKTLAADDRRYFIILAEERPQGLVGLTDLDGRTRRGGWGFYLGEPSGRGRGLALGALCLVLDLAFGPLSLNKVFGEALADNRPSRRLHEALGFTLEAELREHHLKQGRPADVVGYGLLSREWPQARAKAFARLRAKGLDPEAMVILSPYA